MAAFVPTRGDRRNVNVNRWLTGGPMRAPGGVRQKRRAADRSAARPDLRKSVKASDGDAMLVFAGIDLHQLEGVQTADLLAVALGDAVRLIDVLDRIVFAHVKGIVGAENHVIDAKSLDQEIELLDREDQRVEIEFSEIGSRLLVDLVAAIR